ncbi:gamma-glutamylcyclotransferase family protein [Aestuariivirga sp.]|uniref:gamma-glutamylcyclotransferase family protein n=1 Tax=Aestuariivirga sp. TaxID=2650926 RepID=UPI003593E178
MSNLYFAYGSNMSLAQMRSRCPGSVKVGIGVLPGHRVVFPRHSPVRNCGVAGIVPAAEDVWGVIYRLGGIDLASLDKREGYDPSLPDAANRYVRREFSIHVDGEPTAILQCHVYAAIPQPGVHGPSAEYLSTILTGAAENGLPDGYVKKLKELSYLNI